MHFPSPLIVLALAAASLVQAQGGGDGGAAGAAEFTRPFCRGDKTDIQGSGDMQFQGSTRSVKLPPGTYTAFNKFEDGKCGGDNLGNVPAGCKNLSRTGIRCIQRS